MKIYTKTGDAGQTGLFDGTRVSKADPRVDAYGSVDELGAWLGVIRAAGPGPDLDELLAHIQRDLFALGAVLADPAHKISARKFDKVALGPENVARLERAIDAFEAELPPLRRFILAGGSPGGAMLHLARTVCRRAERGVVALSADHVNPVALSADHVNPVGLGAEQIDPIALTYINRLSDLLFVMARLVNHRAGISETEW